MVNDRNKRGIHTVRGRLGSPRTPMMAFNSVIVTCLARSTAWATCCWCWGDTGAASDQLQDPQGTCPFFLSPTLPIFPFFFALFYPFSPLFCPILPIFPYVFCPVLPSFFPIFSVQFCPFSPIFLLYFACFPLCFSALFCPFSLIFFPIFLLLFPYFFALFCPFSPIFFVRFYLFSPIFLALFCPFFPIFWPYFAPFPLFFLSYFARFPLFFLPHFGCSQVLKEKGKPVAAFGLSAAPQGFSITRDFNPISPPAVPGRAGNSPGTGFGECSPLVTEKA